MATMRSSGGLRKTGGGGGGGGAASAGTHAPSAITISSTEYERIRREAFADSLQVSSKADDDEAALKAARREASQARAGTWPNTMSGLRAAKVRAREDERAAREQAAKELDAVEDNLRMQERLAVLRRANDYYAGQSDRMKALDNFRLRSYDVEAEKAQAELKASKRAALAAREADYARTIALDVAAAAQEEEARREEARAKAARNVADQKAQLAAVIARRMEELRQRDEEGRAMQAQVRELEAQAQEQASRKAGEAAAKLRLFKEENDRLSAMRKDLKSGEAQAMQWIEEAAEGHRRREQAIREIIERQRAEAVRKAKIISEIMERDLASRTSTEEAGLARDIAGAEAKSAAAAEAQLRKKQEMKDSILAHIEAMRRKTMQSILDQRAQDAADQEVFLGKLAALEAQEAADAAARRSTARDYQLMQRAQMADKKRVVEGSIAWDAREGREANALAGGGPMDKAFYAEVERVRAEEIARGNDTKPLDRLVHKLLNPPMIPNLQRS